MRLFSAAHEEGWELCHLTESVGSFDSGKSSCSPGNVSKSKLVSMGVVGLNGGSDALLNAFG